MCVTIVQTEVFGEKNNTQNYQLLFTLIEGLFHRVDYNIFTKECLGLVLNWQTIPRHSFVQPLSMYLKFEGFYYKIPLSSGFVYNT